MNKLTASLLLPITLLAALSTGCASEGDERKEEVLGRILDPEKWNDGENTFTSNGVHYAIVGSGKYKCYAKMELIPGSGEGREEDSTSDFKLVGVSKDFDGKVVIEIAKLPDTFAANALNMAQSKFDELIGQTRDASTELGAICADR